MKKLYSLLFLLLLLNACSFNQSFVNREEDKDGAKNISDKFYWEMVYGGNKDNLYNLFSDKLFEVLSKTELDSLTQKIQKEKGVIEGYELAGWETLIVKGTNPKNDYVLKYDVQRELGLTHETVSMNKENGEIKIIGYHINIPEK